MPDPIPLLDFSRKVLEFIDYSLTLLSRPRVLTPGVRLSMELLQIIFMTLNDLTSDIKAAGFDPQDTHGDDKKLYSIAKDCLLISTGLLEVMGNIKSKIALGPGWPNFYYAIESEWAKEKVELVYDKLSRLRAGLNATVGNLIQ